MFDPYAKIVYDYVAGIEDIKKAKVCMYSIQNLSYVTSDKLGIRNVLISSSFGVGANSDSCK